MITDAAQGILQHHVKEYTREVLDYIEKYSHNRVARNILPVRKIGADKSTDVVTTYKRMGAGAIVAAKGVIPSGSGTTVSETEHAVYQILDGFDLHEKDMSLDPKAKNRNVDLCTRNIYRAEDDFVLNGHTALNVSGLADVIPSTNSITTSTNHGAWSGSEANDIHADIVSAIALMDQDFDPDWIVGHPTDIGYLRGLDSERQPYWSTIIDLFPNAKKPEDFLYKSNRLTAGTVYLGTKDMLAAELVVSENVTVSALPMQRGRIYPIEIYEWVVPEFHTPDCFVSIATG